MGFYFGFEEFFFGCCCPVGTGATFYPDCNHKVGFVVCPRQLLQLLSSAALLGVLLTSLTKINEDMFMYANKIWQRKSSEMIRFAWMARPAFYSDLKVFSFCLVLPNLYLAFRTCDYGL